VCVWWGHGGGGVEQGEYGGSGGVRESREGAGTSRGRPRIVLEQTPIFRVQDFFERRCAGEGEMRRRGAPQGGAVGGENTQNL
jgi:hypothetical protein